MEENVWWSRISFSGTNTIQFILEQGSAENFMPFGKYLFFCHWALVEMECLTMGSSNDHVVRASFMSRSVIKISSPIRNSL